MKIRNAEIADLSRIAEIYVYNNRINYLPIFKDVSFSFGELQVIPMVDHYFKKEEIRKQLFVYEDEVVKGFIQMNGSELCKLYVDPFFQNEGIGNQLIEYAIDHHHAALVWALEKNTRAIAFYQRKGFVPTGEKKFEEGTTEYLIKLVR